MDCKYYFGINIILFLPQKTKISLSLLLRTQMSYAEHCFLQQHIFNVKKCAKKLKQSFFCVCVMLIVIDRIRDKKLEFY